MRRLPFQAFLSHDVYSAAKSVLFHLTEPLDEKKETHDGKQPGKKLVKKLAKIVSLSSWARSCRRTAPTNEYCFLYLILKNIKIEVKKCLKIELMKLSRSVHKINTCKRMYSISFRAVSIAHRRRVNLLVPRIEAYSSIGNSRFRGKLLEEARGA